MQSVLGNWNVPAASGTQLVLDLDAANYAAVPVNGSTIAGTGGYAITVNYGGESKKFSSGILFNEIRPELTNLQKELEIIYGSVKEN